MKATAFMLIGAACAVTGCATLVHGPYQDVTISSEPPGATAVVSAQMSQRGPLFLDTEKQTVTTPATVRLKRDNDYRIELSKPGYKIANRRLRSEYDWLWASVLCGPCEAVGALPTYDLKERSWPVRFAQAAFYEYPVGFVRALGRATRLVSPDAVLGNAFKLKDADAGYFDNWHALDAARVVATLEPLDR